MNIVQSAIAVVTLIGSVGGGVWAMDQRHVSLQSWQVQERQTLEWRVDQTRTEIARARSDTERGRLQGVLQRLMRELCSKYPRSYVCR